jgi:predicted GNAT family N-acyltransferase
MSDGRLSIGLVSEPIQDCCVHEVGQLVISAAPEFYELLNVPSGVLEQAVAGQVGGEGFELETGYLACLNGAVAGLVCTIASEKLQVAQMNSARALLRLLPPDLGKRTRARLSAYALEVEPLRTTAIYLSRVAVGTAFRGGSTATELMQHVIGQSSAQPHCLHVNRNHKGVVAFYRRFGFERVSDDDFRYVAMVRQA